MLFSASSKLLLKDGAAQPLGPDNYHGRGKLIMVHEVTAPEKASVASCLLTIPDDVAPGLLGEPPNVSAAPGCVIADAHQIPKSISLVGLGMYGPRECGHLQSSPE